MGERKEGSVYVANTLPRPTIGGRYDIEPKPSRHHPEAVILHRNEDSGRWIVGNWRPVAIDGVGYLEVDVSPADKIVT